MTRALKKNQISLFSEPNQTTLLKPPIPKRTLSLVPPPRKIVDLRKPTPIRTPTVSPAAKISNPQIKEPVKTRKITLTARAPIEITIADWPTLARTAIDWREDEHQKVFRLTVIQHADGRAIVYGLYQYRTTEPGNRPISVRGGESLANSKTLPDAIARVGHWLADQPHSKGDYTIWQNMIYKTATKLPAVKI